MLPNKLAFVDIETTGVRAPYDRIIEIGIVLLDNDTISDTYSSLINPGGPIPPEITHMTGITQDAVATAPSFREIAPDVITRLKDYTFVAHNVRFDYGFLKHEFARLGGSFSSKHFCTVRLSRTLFPEHPRHNLDALIERFGLSCKNRHRALDDAMAICEFYQQVQKRLPEKIFTAAMNQVLKKPYLPVKLKGDILDSLPETPGVYIFYGENGSPLYIGKSINIKERVLSHFSGDLHSPLEMKIAQQIESLETITTAGELGALFLESQLIKTRLPLYNRMLRKKQELLALKQKEDSNGYSTIEMLPLTEPPLADLPQFLGFFRSRKQAKDYLANLAKEHSLCEKLLGLEKTNSSCFGYRLERCKGACVTKEQSVSYNLRFLEAFGKTKIKRWPFQGPIVIEEKDMLGDKVEYFLIDQWCYLGSVTADSLGSYDEKPRDYAFDLDTYKILVRYILSEKHALRIHELPHFSQELQ